MGSLNAAVLGRGDLQQSWQLQRVPLYERPDPRRERWAGAVRGRAGDLHFLTGRDSTLRGRSGGNTPSRLFLLMQSASISPPEGQHLPAGGPARSPPATWSSHRPSHRPSHPRSLPPEHTERLGRRVCRLLNSSCPHGRRNNEGNCLSFWLYFNQKMGVGVEPATPQRHSWQKGDGGSTTVVWGHADLCNTFLVNHRWMGPFQTSC